MVEFGLDFSQSQSQVQSRMQLAVAAQDPALVTDLRKLNKGRPEMFDVFWKELEKYLNEVRGK